MTFFIKTHTNFYGIDIFLSSLTNNIWSKMRTILHNASYFERTNKYIALLKINNKKTKQCSSSGYIIWQKTYVSWYNCALWNVLFPHQTHKVPTILRMYSVKTPDWNAITYSSFRHWDNDYFEVILFVLAKLLNCWCHIQLINHFVSVPW